MTEFIVKEEIPPSDIQARFQYAYGGDSMGASCVSVFKKACCTVYVVRTTSAEFGLPAGKAKFHIHNEE